jgi:hypothetical protein
MARMAFLVNDNAKQIVKCLNHFTKDTGLIPMNGNANSTSCYYIDYDPGTYKITNYDCENSPRSVDHYYDTIPVFMTLPLDIQIEIVKRSKSKSPIPFLKNIAASTSGGGFTWSDTPKGYEFWNSVLMDGDIDLFYKQFKSKENESRLQEQESPLRGGSGEIKCGLCCRKHKPRVEVKPVGYKKVIGRG